jgi:bifunctional non-homologous end joining protein LigD
MRKKRGAADARLPASLGLELATLVASPPKESDYWHEIKWDGYRLLARIEGQDIQLVTRNGNEWTSKAPGVTDALRALDLRDTAIDGELCALQPGGRSDFGLLQRSMGSRALVFVAFDLLFADGRDLRPLPLRERKAALAALLRGLPSSSVLRLSEHFEQRGPEVFENACKLQLEGIVSKRASSPYRAGRSRDWLKTKCVSRQEFVIVGYRVDDGLHHQVRSLLLGVVEGERFRYAGKVGTGFSGKQLRELYMLLSPSVVPRTYVYGAPRGAEARDLRWVEPRLVAEVSFTEFTRDGTLRHPVFLGLRGDKPRQAGDT